MKIIVNGEPTEVSASTLTAILEELGYRDEKVATAINEAFVPAATRGDASLEAGDRLEIVTPRQGG